MFSIIFKMHETMLLFFFQRVWVYFLNSWNFLLEWVKLANFIYLYKRWCFHFGCIQIQVQKPRFLSSIALAIALKRTKRALSAFMII